MRHKWFKHLIFTVWFVLFSVTLSFSEEPFGFDEPAADTKTSETSTDDDLGSFGFSDDASSGDDFGFSANTTDTSAFSIKVGGGLYTGFPIFFNDFKSIQDTRLGSLFWGTLHVKATAPVTEAYFGVSLNERTLGLNLGDDSIVFPAKPQIPGFIDEAYAQLMIGPVVFGGGIKKITWGKADALSVLDIVNPQDLSNPSVSDITKMKRARPMLYLSSYLPYDMKIEAVFLPVFEGHYLPMGGRWKPAQLDDQQALLETPIKEQLKKNQHVANRLMWLMLPSGDSVTQSQIDTVLDGLPPGLLPASVIAHLKTKITPDLLKQVKGGGFTDINAAKAQIEKEIQAALANLNTAMPSPNTARLKYAQGGVRFTIPIAGTHDVGLQYYYGHLPLPAQSVDMSKLYIDIQGNMPYGNRPLWLGNNSVLPFSIDYNVYHQIGIDYAAALGPANIRMEFAANITEDLKGDNPVIYNPHLAWNAGFDYTMPYGVSINILASEKIRLLHNKIGSSPYDIEKNTKITETRIMLMLSQRLMRDSFEWRLVGIMGVEDLDFVIMPSIQFQYGTVVFNLNAGIFGGKKKGQLGQYIKNSFLKLSVGYVF